MCSHFPGGTSTHPGCSDRVEMILFLFSLGMPTDMVFLFCDRACSDLNPKLETHVSLWAKGGHVPADFA